MTDDARPVRIQRKRVERRIFIGTFQCSMCPKRVRVYDWLPEDVKCSTCNTKMLRQEATMVEPAAIPMSARQRRALRGRFFTSPSGHGR